MKEQATAKCPGQEGSLSVERVASASLPTEWGDFQIAGYRSLTSDEEFVALFKGELRRDSKVFLKKRFEKRSAKLRHSKFLVRYSIFYCFKQKK